MADIFCHFFAMDYKEVTEWMFKRLPMYQRQGASAYKTDLTNTLALTAYLGNPEQKIKTIHIAGTNGKGSVAAMLASVLQHAGYKTGLYTSPHLKDFRERIKINGNEISKGAVVEFITEHKSFFEKEQLSFFEMTVGLAFDYYANKKVDIAVIETGMGGRLDSTNVITPLVSVITNIGLDHTQFLGDTLAKIAAEKAGIIKNEIPVIIGEHLPETKPVFEATAKFNNAQIYYTQDNVLRRYETDLEGDYQKRNIKTVVLTLKILQQHFKISQEAIITGLNTVAATTGLKGRWQKIKNKPMVICDTAHNANGLQIVMQQVMQHKYNVLHIVFGVVNDKNLDEILPLLPKNAKYYFCKPNVPRGLESSVLLAAASLLGLKGEIYSSASEAYNTAINNAGQDDFIYIGGSTFVVAEII